jgi:2,4-dienoyl-CoA reductase-like NADH-dependent reductase (Old Yellow Enzyme family)
MQLNHPGRQSPRRVCEQPVSPSGTPLAIAESAFALPRTITVDEIRDLPRRFAFAAIMAEQAGFTGVQIHAAHGYLLSQFLSPLANRRTDEWGGSLRNRARVLLAILSEIRSATRPRFCLSVKLNSSDFQQGGFSSEECIEVVRWLGDAGVDLVEISGGNYEKPVMMGAVSASTEQRESYFAAYAASIKQSVSVPIMLTGGFRTRAVMDAALENGVCDVIGLGRPMCVKADLPNELLSGRLDALPAQELAIVPRKAVGPWYCLQLIRLAQNVSPDWDLQGDAAIAQYAEYEDALARSVLAARSCVR